MGWSDFWAALCLVAVMEGLILFGFPRGWKRTAEQMLQLPDEAIRRLGAVILIAGLVSLYFVRGAG